MKTMRIIAIAAILMMFAIPAMNTDAQSLRIQQRVNFWVNVPFEMAESDMVLPAGDYVLYQILPNDLTLFALYKDNLASEPIAMIRTSRIGYAAKGYPGETKMLLDMDVESNHTYPVITGWNIPGMDGWQILSVVAEDNVMTYGYSNSRPAPVKADVVIKATSYGFSSK